MGMAEGKRWSATQVAEDGGTVVEYAVLTALIIGVLIGLIATVGGSLLLQLTNFVNSWP